MNSIINYTRSSPNEGTAATEENSSMGENVDSRNHASRTRGMANHGTKNIKQRIFNPNDSLLSRFHVQADGVLTTSLRSSNRSKALNQDDSSVIESIRWMSSHVPRCVMQDLTKEAMLVHKRENSMSKMPFAQTYRAALLFIDMSGFTQLSQLLDVESLSKNINLYFEKIIDEVTKYGGDVLKFAGDAIFAEWRIHDKFKNSNEESLAIQLCVHSAASCGASVVAKCSDFPVFVSSGVNDGQQVATLNVHCGLGFGSMAGIHVGNDHMRREFIFLGNPIDQVSKACNIASHGELMASPEAYDILTQRASRRILVTMRRKQKTVKPSLIASREKRFFREFQSASSKKKQTTSTSNTKQFAIPFDRMDSTMLEYLQKLVSLYVHPVVFSDVRSRRSSGEASIVQAQHRAEAEIRSVYTIFVKVLVSTELDRRGNSNQATFDLLNNILNEVVTMLKSFKAHLRQFIVDDKGVILIGTFGLRGSTSPKMAKERVLPACRMIHYALQNDLGVDNYIGASLGKAYCGVVGSLRRHEFAVMGPSVNLAARLLSKSNHPGVLIDDHIRSEALDWGTFFEFPPMKAKGYKHLVPVFQPTSATESRWGKVNPHFVGRKSEMQRVSAIARAMAVSEGPCRILVVWGDSGAGKSDFLVQTVSLVRRLIFTSRRRLILTRNVGNEGDVLIPFSAFRSIFKDLLNEKKHIEKATSKSKSKLRDKTPSERFMETRSFQSSSTFSTINTAAADQLHDLCSELGAPKTLLRIVGHHLLGLSFKSATSDEKLPKIDEIIDFMAQMFIHSTMHADLTIVALDDLQFMDDLSWKVILKIFESGSNVMFLCGSRPYMFVKEGFFKEVKTTITDNSRFQELEMGPLHRLDIARMIALVLDVRVAEIDSHFVKDLYDHTRGMPNFALQVLKACNSKSMFQRLENNKVGVPTGTSMCRETFSSLRNLMIQRIDGLDDFTRKILHMASILGHTFTSNEVIELTEQVLSITVDKKADHLRKVEESLKIVVKEGILDDNAPHQSVRSEFFSFQQISTSTFQHMEEYEEGDIDDLMDDENVNQSYYQFNNDSWRQAVLSLLLDSYKQDMHQHAATSIETRIVSLKDADYHTKIRLYNHLKLSGNNNKATDLALSVGKSFMGLSLSLHSIHIYNQTLDMWHRNSVDDGNDTLAGIPLHVIQSLDKDNLKSIIRLLTALGQALGTTLTRKVESAQSFEDALQILKKCPSTKELKDRSFIFPIYSGLFFLLKMGGLISVQKEKEYEQNLVSNFVEETRLHGDPVHYSRSLAMQGEFFCRQGKYAEALECHEKLKRVYNVKKHSALVAAAYNSDRSAQNFAVTANCLYRLGRVKDALQLCNKIINDMMPQMDLKNIHNSAIMMFPLLWILKNERMSKKAANAFDKYVIDPFYLHYGKNGKTFTLSLFKPIKVLLSISMFLEGHIKKLDANFFSWALEETSFPLNYSFNKSAASFGRCGASIGSEICLILSKQTDDVDMKIQLVRRGWDLVQEAMKIAVVCGEHQTAYIDTKPIYDELNELIASSDDVK